MGEIARPARAKGRNRHRDLSENEGTGALTSRNPGGQDRAVPKGDERWRDSMVVLKRADGNWAGDLDLTRRGIAMALAGGYAVAAFSADAEPIHTDEQGLVTATVDIP